MSNFHITAETQSIHVHEGRWLRCRIIREDGEHVDAEMDLNCCIGNDNGRFQWGGQNFSESAEDIRFDLEGDGQPILRARLRNVDGELQECDINLTERIMNRDGQLCFGKTLLFPPAQVPPTLLATPMRLV